MNGVVNCSVLDGWWDEGWTGDNGWAIGGRETNPDEGAQDWADAQDLYRHPRERDRARATTTATRRACPRALAGAACASRSPARSGSSRPRRMLHEYVEQLYLPAAPAARHAGLEPPCGRRARPIRADRGRSSQVRTVAGRASRSRSPSTTTSRWATSAGSSRTSSTQAYEPMVEALERHPDVRLGAALHRAAARVAARPSGRSSSTACGRWSSASQVEILGGGLYEPVLASLPERDRRRPAAADGARSSRRRSARRPRGAWLAERVWEPDAADVARRRRLPLDDPRRQPLPRPRRSPRSTCGARTRPTTRAAC